MAECRWRGRQGGPGGGASSFLIYFKIRTILVSYIMKTKTKTSLSLDDFARRVVELMPRMARLMIREERNYLARGIISLPQLWAMMTIAEQGPCSMQTIALSVGLRSSTLTSLVDRLVTLDLVKRRHDAGDRRQVLAELTAKGRRVLEHIHQEKIKGVIETFGPLSAQERSTYLSAIEKITNQARPAAKAIRKVVAGLLFLAGMHATAAEPAYTLEDCIRMGLEQSVPVANARRDEQAARGRIRQVRAQVLPQLTGHGRYTRLDEVEAFDLGQGPIQMGELDNYLVSAEASQLLYSGGAVQAALKAAKIYRQRTLLETQRQERTLVRDIRTAFYTILLAEATVSVQEASVEQLKGLVKQAEAKFRNDTASEFDLLSAQVRLANQEPFLIKARRDVQVAREAFRNLIHLEEDTYRLEGRLEYEPLQADYERWLAEGLQRRPELSQQEQVIDLWEQDIRVEKANYLPTIKARAAYEGTKPPASFSSDSDWDWGWNAGLTAEWKFLDGGLRSGKLMEKGMELEKARDNLRDLRRAVELEIHTACLDLTHAAEAVTASMDTIRLAEKSMDIARTRYDVGLSTYLEYTDANLALSEARLLWNGALREHLAAKARLAFACGVNTLEELGEKTP